MKKFLATLLAFCLLAAGCVFVPKQPNPNNPNPSTNSAAIYIDEDGLLVVGGLVADPKLVGSSVSIVTSIELASVTQGDTNSIAYLTVVKSALDASLTNGVFDPAKLRAALDVISIREIRNNALLKDIVALQIEGYGKYYYALGAQGIDNVSPYLRPILQGISDGIGRVVTPLGTPPKARLKVIKK